MKKVPIILVTIIVIAFSLRVVNFTANSLYGDELTLVYDSYSLLKTGMDQTGQAWPVTFSMGAGRPAGYVYGSIPLVALFGLNQWGVRGLSLLSGLGIILLSFLLVRKLLSTRVALATAALLAISPWEIALSRGGFEAHLALFFALIGITAFIYAKQKPWLYLLAAISFGLTIHTYPTYKLTVPLLLILLIWYQGGLKKIVNDRSRKLLAAAIVVLLLAVAVALHQLLTGGSETRFWNINVFSQTDLGERIIQKVNFERNVNLLPLLAPLFHNRFSEYALILGESYLSNLSPDFLFLHGDKIPRHNPAEMGSLYVVEIVLIIIGMRFLWAVDRKLLILLSGWILITPLATALLLEPHALRNSLMLPALVILSATGLTYLWQRSMQHPVAGITLTVVVIGLLMQFLFVVERIYFLAPNKHSQHWADPAKQASQLAIQSSNNFDYVILSDRIDNIEFAYPVYARVDPQEVISQNQHRSNLGNQRFKKFGNVYIGNIPERGLNQFLNSLGGSVLYLGSIWEKEALGDYQVVYGRDLLPAFLTLNR